MPYSSSSLQTEYISKPLVLDEALLVNIGEYIPALLELDFFFALPDELLELAPDKELLVELLEFPVVDSPELLLVLLPLVVDALEELELWELGVLALLNLVVQ